MHAFLTWNDISNNIVWDVAKYLLVPLLARAYRAVVKSKKLSNFGEVGFFLIFLIAGAMLIGAHQSLVKSPNRENPEFITNLNWYTFGQNSVHDQRGNMIIVLGLQISNAGSPSVVRNWSFDLKLSNGETMKPPYYNIVGTNALVLLASDPKHRTPSFKAEDQIALKTRYQPIDQGASVEGIVALMINDVVPSHITQPGNVIIVKFTDVKGRQYEIAQPLSTTMQRL